MNVKCGKTFLGELSARMSMFSTPAMLGSNAARLMLKLTGYAA
jgi:hypothetical protein